MTAFDPLPYAIPAFVLLMAAEIVWARRAGRSRVYEGRDTAVSLLLGIGSLLAGAIAAIVTVPLLFGAGDASPFNLGWAWWIWGLCFFADDLAYYWFHRTAHRARWFWAAHVNHHSSQHYNLATALRQSWTSFFALSFLFRIPLALVGFEPGMVLTCAAFNLIYQFWIHTQAIDRMPNWFEAVMNTPSHHRVHHATNAPYLDRNFAGTFIIWDKLFGSFEAEARDVPIRYGIVNQLGNFSLLNAAFHEWIGIGKDVLRAPWRHKLSYIWREPGWSHDGSRETSDMIRSRVKEAEAAQTRD